MATHPLFPAQAHPPIALAPTLFIGIDVGKKRHVAAFISPDLLKKKRFEQCPVLPFEQSRAGLLAFQERVKTYVASPARAAIVVEATGHYHRALCEELIDAGFSVYIVAVRSKRTAGLNKTDVHDARRLAHHLYAQLSLGLQLEEKGQQARKLAPALEVAMLLRGLVQRRYEVSQSLTRTKNKLIALADELFPELSTVFRNPCAEVALDLRQHFPTPDALARASLPEMRVVRRLHGPSDAKLLRLQVLAKTSIGVTNPARVSALLFEQEQLIESFSLLEHQMNSLEEKIECLVAGSREGQILLSLPSVKSIHAATLIAMIGNIRNFPRKCELRKFCGWAPKSTQTGTSFDRAEQSPSGSRLLKRALYLITTSAISHENTVWSTLYNRLLPLKCSYDSRKKEYTGRMRVIGRVAGQMAGVIYVLLKDDAALVDAVPAGQELPAPQLYDPEIHAGTKAKPVVSPALTNRHNSGMMA